MKGNDMYPLNVYGIMGCFKNSVTAGWTPYGINWENAYVLDFETEHAEGDVYFHKDELTVYMIDVGSKNEVDNYYRWINPEFEATAHPDDKKNAHIISSYEEFITVLEKIVSGEKIVSDEKVEEWTEFDLNISLDDFNTLALRAHELNITFNDLVNDILRTYLDINRLNEARRY